MNHPSVRALSRSSLASGGVTCPHRSLLVVLVAAIATLNVLTRAAQGQTPPPLPLTYERVITGIWKDLHDKILVMAKDTVFPDDKLGWKPHPDSRSVLEEFRHVTIGLEFSSAQLRGEKFDRAAGVARQKADAGRPNTRASIVSEMEAAIAISYPLVEKSPTPLLIGWIREQAEHYGKLVSNYRAVGIVPPISRKPASQ
jgi:hypothetical protein